VIVIGCDPGQTGAFALVDDTGALVDIYDMPVVANEVSPQLIAELGFGFDIDAGCAVIEDVHSMPKQGVASSFKFGRSKGVVEGYFAGAGISLRYVSPAKWKRDLHLTRDKGVSRQRALELWPEKAGLFKRVKDDGRAEAALIAWWWIHHGTHTGGNPT
jgi:crossover junction endodeoxyribonuclease RuvC